MEINMSCLFYFSWIIAAGLITTCVAQNFEPGMDDKEYLDMIQKKLRQEVMDAHFVLINQTKILQQVTRAFIETKIKENLFKAVRARVEMELNATTTTTSSRQARQEEEEEDDGATSVRPGLLPQLANVVSAIFGGNVNVTDYVKTATAFLPTQVSSQLVGAINLIDPSRFTSTTTTTTTSQPTLITINGTTYAYAPGQAVPSDGLQVGGIQGNPQQLIAVVQTQGGGFTPIQSVGANPVANQVGGTNQNPAIPIQGAGIVQNQSPGIATNQNPTIVVNQNPGIIPPIAQNQNILVDSNQGVWIAQNSATGTIQSQQSGAAPSQNTGAVQGDIGGSRGPAIQPAFPPRVPHDYEDEDNSSSGSGTTVKSPQDEEGSGEIEDDLPQDDESVTVNYLDEYPALKVAYNLYSHLTRTEIPTTTEFININTTKAGGGAGAETTIDYLDDEEPTTPPSSTVTMLVQSGIYLYEGAREAYQLLQQVNKYLDKVNERFETAGYGSETVGVDV